jgi:hypothetical protein
MRDIRGAYTNQLDSRAAALELAEQWSMMAPQLLVVFASHHHAVGELSGLLKEKYPQAEVVGCTTAGEFTSEHTSVGGVVGLALSNRKIKRCQGALATFENGVAAGIHAALLHIGASLDIDVRRANPERYVGLLLIDGLKMNEEEANEALGNEAPLLSFIGGSAGDNLEFKETRVFYNGKESTHGAVLLLMETEVPFLVTKTCSFEPTQFKFKVTRSDVARRVIYELDGQPVVQQYAKAVGVEPDALSNKIFMSHPLGLMIDGAPWIRSPQQVLPDGGLKFYCKVLEDMDLVVMQSRDLVADTRRAVEDARQRLPSISGGLLFNCILRRLELDSLAKHDAFLETFSGLETAGFHTYGESWLGHINQTLTALFFG